MEALTSNFVLILSLGYMLRGVLANQWLMSKPLLLFLFVFVGPPVGNKFNLEVFGLVRFLDLRKRSF